MRTIIRAAAITLTFSLSLTGAAMAQGKQQPKQAPAAKQAAPEPEPEGTEQIALTEQQVQGFISITPEINKITSSLKGEPDQKTVEQLEALAKKGGFTGLDQYETVSANIEMVVQGIDPQTKKFGDPKAMMQAQIKQVQADKSMKAAEKKEVLAELNQAIKDIQPIKNQGNIALVEKNYDKIAALMQPQN